MTGRLVAIARRAAKRAPMLEAESGEITLESGLVGDSRGAPGRRQVTVLDAAAWRAVCEELGCELPWTHRRANLLVEGVDLEDSAGCRLKVGDVLLEITCETTPCERMDEQQAGLGRALEPSWRGGVCCRVLRGGAVRPGDPVAMDGA